VADVILVLSDAGDDVTIHNLHVVYIKQQFHPGRADLLNYFHAVIGVVALIAGMTLHLDIHTAVKNLQAEVDFLFLGIADDFLVTVNAVFDADIIRDILAETGKGDYAGKAGFCAGIDGVAEFLGAGVVVGWVVHSFVKAVAAGDGADEAVFLEGRPVFRLDQLDALAAEPIGYLTGLLDVPVLLETPVSDGLVDATSGGGSLRAFVDSIARREGQGRGASGPNFSGDVEHTATADTVVRWLV